jgi:16S rRNA (cytidine1402-2'-O)-methyltransferase
LEALADVVEVLGPARHVVVAREVTKLHEEFLRGPAAEMLEQLRSRGELKGEITLLIGKAEELPATEAVSPRSVRRRISELMQQENLDEKGALKMVAKEFGISKSEAYRELQRSR